METHQTQTDSALTHEQTNNSLANRAVTSTTQNVGFINSIIISRDGKDLATLSEHFPAKAVGGASGYHVTGQLTPGAGEKGFLQLEWPHPTPQDAGNFKCDVSTLDQVGHSVDFSQTLAVAESEVTMADLVAHLTVQQTVVGVMNGTIQSMKQENAGLKHTVDDLDKKILKLESEKIPDIFFSVAYTSGSTTPSGVIRYNLVSANKGNAYSTSTGTFTCPLAGFYHFEMNVATEESKYAYLYLRKNGNHVMRVLADGNDNSSDYAMSTNSIIVQLVKGDKLQVSFSGSGLSGINSDYKTNSWTGRLVALP